MRFVLSLWSLVFLALVVFSSLILFQHLIVPEATPFEAKLFLLGATWVLTLAITAAIHILYRRSERTIYNAACDEVATQLAGAVAHELNQPLTVVLTAAELMTYRDRSREELLTISKQMADASNRMADIVTKLQRVNCYQSKPYVGDVRIIDLDRSTMSRPFSIHSRKPVPKAIRR